MTIGVTYDEFWHGEPELVRYAIEAAELRQKNDAILADILAWNTGRYVMLGTGVVFSQAFSKNSSAKYPREPMLGPELDDELAEQKRERNLIQQRNSFLAVAAALSPKGQPASVPSGADT